jgi:hypothetical protein
MAVGNSHTLDDWLGSAGRCGFCAADILDLTEQIMPNLLRFERMAEHYLRRRIFQRALRAVLPAQLIDNIAAAYLMPITVRSGIHRYSCVVLRAG